MSRPATPGHCHVFLLKFRASSFEHDPFKGCSASSSTLPNLLPCPVRSCSPLGLVLERSVRTFRDQSLIRAISPALAEMIPRPARFNNSDSLPDSCSCQPSASGMSAEGASPLFLGLDLSTQQLKAIIVAEDTSVAYKFAVNFTEDLPQYRTTNGVFIGPGPGEVTSPVAMWVHAIDLLMERARISGFDTSRVVAISGAGQVCLRMNTSIQNC